MIVRLRCNITAYKLTSDGVLKHSQALVQASWLDERNFEVVSNKRFTKLHRSQSVTEPIIYTISFARYYLHSMDNDLSMSFEMPRVCEYIISIMFPTVFAHNVLCNICYNYYLKLHFKFFNCNLHT